MDYDLYDSHEGESFVSDIPLSIIEDEIRYLLDIKANVDQANEERCRELEKIRTAMRHLEFYDSLDPF